MLFAVMLLLACEIGLAAWWARRLRPCRNHISFVEIFIWGHFYFFVVCLPFCEFTWSGAGPRDLWYLVPLLGLVFLGVCLGAFVVRHFAGSFVCPPAGEIPPESKSERARNLLLCGLLWVVTVDASVTHPESLFVLVRMPYWERVMDATRLVPLFLLNAVSIVPVVLFGVRVLHGKGRRQLTAGLFAVAVMVQVATSLLTGARARLLHVVAAVVFLGLYSGSRRLRRFAVVMLVVGGIVFVMFAYPLRIYRETGDVGEAWASLSEQSGQGTWFRDPTNEAADFCMLSIDHYLHYAKWRGLDSIVGVAGWLIPRRFWPGKPVNFGNLMWTDIIGNRSAVGVSPTFLGEFFACAGPYGILPISFFFGVVLAGCQWLLKRWTSSLDYFALEACLAFAAFFTVRGDFTSAFGRSFMIIVPMFLLLDQAARWVLRIMAGSRARGP